jgi:hypothetical protein
MNRSDLERSWAATEGHLLAALEALEKLPSGGATPRDLAQAREFLRQNELALAMETLADGVEGVNVPLGFWVALRDAARNMGLGDWADSFEKRCQGQ